MFTSFGEFQSTVTNFAVRADLATCGIYLKLRSLFRLIWWVWWFLSSPTSIHHPDSAQRPSVFGPDRKLSAKQSRNLIFYAISYRLCTFNGFYFVSKITDTLVELVLRYWRFTKIIFKSLSHFRSKIWSLWKICLLVGWKTGVWLLTGTHTIYIENTGIPIYILAVAFKLIGKLLCFLTLSSHPSRTSRELLRLSPMSWPINGKL
jgi:hypothetical protein